MLLKKNKKRLEYLNKLRVGENVDFLSDNKKMKKEVGFFLKTKTNLKPLFHSSDIVLTKTPKQISKSFFQKQALSNCRDTKHRVPTKKGYFVSFKSITNENP